MNWVQAIDLIQNDHLCKPFLTVIAPRLEDDQGDPDDLVD